MLFVTIRERELRGQAKETRRDNDEGMDCKTWSTCQTQQGGAHHHTGWGVNERPMHAYAHTDRYSTRARGPKLNDSIKKQCWHEKNSFERVSGANI